MKSGIAEVLTEQDQVSETIKSDASKDLALGRGDILRQGDVYIARISELPTTLKKRKSRQLAEGETQGSRHVLTGDAVLFDAEAEDVIRLMRAECKGVELRDYQIGPVFTTPGGCVVEHPEHGNRRLTEAGSYAVFYQRSLTADAREERARD